MPLASAIIDTIRAAGISVECAAAEDGVVFHAVDGDGHRYIVSARDQDAGAIALAEKLGFDLEA